MGSSQNIPIAAGSSVAGGVHARPATSNFRQALEVVGAPGATAADKPVSGFPAEYRIQSGDTLTSIVRKHLQALGREAAPRDIHQGIELLAAANGIANPDRIYSGHSLDLRSLESLSRRAEGSSPPARASQLSAHATLAARVERVQAAARGNAGSAERAVSATQFLASANLPKAPEIRGPFVQLEKTLDRAVARGFIEPTERGQVRDRVVTLAQKYRFSPDDFATVALMESDGFNPRASNGRCHGIIQFCEGTGRGAASVGLQNRAREILDRPVLEQIDLVDRYFADVGLKDSNHPVGLVDLYLSVLTPAARATRQADAALPVGGVQAKVLHVRGEREKPITRNSIFAGLQAHARAKLGEWTSQSVRPQIVSASPSSAMPNVGQRVDHRTPLVDASGISAQQVRPRT